MTWSILRIPAVHRNETCFKPPFLQIILALIRGDPHQPGLGSLHSAHEIAARALWTLRTLPVRRPRLVPGSHEMVRKGKNLVAITLYKQFKCVAIARLRTGNQFSVLKSVADPCPRFLFLFFRDFTENRSIQCDTQLSILLTRTIQTISMMVYLIHFTVCARSWGAALFQGRAKTQQPGATSCGRARNPQYPPWNPYRARVDLGGRMGQCGINRGRRLGSLGAWVPGVFQHHSWSLRSAPSRASLQAAPCRPC